jgi:hypothetical protein
MESNSQYMLRRHREERDAADKASSPKVRELHIELSDRYREAADGDPPPHAPDGPSRPGLPEDFRILD